jgi:hypothetical protein
MPSVPGHTMITILQMDPNERYTLNNAVPFDEVWLACHGPTETIHTE